VHFTHNCTWNHPVEYPCTPGTRSSSRKGAFAKARVLVGPLCLMQLWTVFGLPSNAAHKNQRAERVGCSYRKHPSPKSSILARADAANHNCHSFHHCGHTAQSLGRVGLSSQHLPCDSPSTYRVSVRCVQNFESFSIDWCRCEVLSTPHLFSVSFW
jgi:hypothetical protein